MIARLFDNRGVSHKQDLIDSGIIALALTALSYAVGLLMRWETSLNWLEVFAVFTSYSCTYLCVKERRLNYPIGAVSTAAYTILFLQSNLYLSAILNAYLTPALVYGWIRWRKDTDTRPVTRVAAKWIPAYALVTGAAYIAAVLISQHMGGTMAWTDGVILAGTILAQFLLDNKKLENWAIWFVVDVIATYEYFATHLYLVGFQYIFFLLNTIYGYYVWRKSMGDARIRVDDSNAPDYGAPATGAVR